MKILITGINGQLGSHLNKLVPSKINNHNLEIIAPSRAELDLSNSNKCYEYILKINPDWVINSAAFTNVDQAENSPELVYKVNTQAPLFFAKALLECNGQILQISTDYVFDGVAKQPYNSSHTKNPLGVYGDSKAKSEDVIEDILFPTNQAKIMRTSWILAPEKNNFALKILKLCNEQETLKIVSDQIGSPSSVSNLALACWRVIEFHEKGISLPNILHWSDSGVASWFDVAMSIYEFGLSLGLIRGGNKIIPIKTNQYPTLAKRPAFSLLDCSDTIQALQLEPSYWRQSLMEILKTYKYNS